MRVHRRAKAAREEREAVVLLQYAALPLSLGPGLLDAHELRVVLAERLLGLELHLHGLAGLCSLERALERLEQAAVAAVQIGVLVFGGVQQRALRVVHLDLQPDDRIPADLHQDRSLFTRSKTSAAWPRGLTPYSAWRMTPFLSMTKVERTR